nr:MAG TPA: hypothetical protein [Caudoviricetes sp.]
MPTTYTTRTDDRWDAIAKAQLGGEMYVTQLMQANPQFLDYYALPEGVVLTIPDISADTEANLPAWRRA